MTPQESTADPATQALTDAVIALTAKVHTADKLAGRTARWLHLTIIGLVLDFTLTIFGAGLFVQQRHTTNQLDRVQTVVSREVLCPLYGVILKAYHPELQKPADRPAYEHAFAVIRAGDRALHCS